MARWFFKQWMDGELTTERTFQIGATDITLTATYVAGYNLSVNTNIDPVNCQINGQPVTTPFFQVLLTGNYVIVMPATVGNYRFKQWTDGDTNPAKTISLNADTILAAIYELQLYSLTVNYVDMNNVPIASPTVQQVPPGIVNVFAPPITGYRFWHWSDGDVSNPKSLTVNTNMVLSAIYELIPQTWSLQITSSPINVNFTISNTPFSTPYSQTLAPGSYVAAMPEEASGYRFKQWSDGDIHLTRTISLNANKILSAVYELIPTYPLSVTASPINVTFTINGTAQTTPYVQNLIGGLYIITMPSLAPGDYKFKQWSDGSVDPVRNVNLGSAVVLTAIYEYSPPPPDKGTLEVHAFVDSIELVIPITVAGVPYNTPYMGQLLPGTYEVKGTYLSQTLTKSAVIMSKQTTRVDLQFTAPPELHALSITSDPNVSFTYDSVTATTPFLAEVAEGSYTINMPALAPNGYTFKQWNDGDTNRIKTIILDRNTTLSVVYEYIPPPPGKAIVIIAVEGNGITIPAAGIYSNYTIGDDLQITALPKIGWFYLKMKRNNVDWTVENPGLITNLQATEDIEVVFSSLTGRPTSEFPFKGLERFPQLYQIVYTLWSRMTGKT